MNDSLDHLSPEHRADLARLVEMIRFEVRDVEMIILFGSFARGDWKTEADLPPPEVRRSGHPSDYDLLAITSNPATGQDAGLWERLSMKSFHMGLQTHARIIGYYFTTINEQLGDGRYFYVDIVREGKVLYNTGRRTLATPRRIPEEKRKAFAAEYFESGLESANQFFKGFEFYLAEGDCKRSAFLLHQASENAYKTILLVFTNHSPKEHWLNVLGELAAMHAPSVSNVFPLDTPENEERFKRLNEAYIGARYDLKYTISKEDLETLAESVRELLGRTKSACAAELERMG